MGEESHTIEAIDKIPVSNFSIPNLAPGTPYYCVSHSEILGAI